MILINNYDIKGVENKATIYGLFLKLTDPAIVEICAHAGFDLCIIDMEHGSIGYEQAQKLIHATEIITKDHHLIEPLISIFCEIK